MDEYENGTYNGDTVDDMWTDYDYHVNTGELNDWFPNDNPVGTSVAESDYVDNEETFVETPDPSNPDVTRSINSLNKILGDITSGRIYDDDYDWPSD